MPGPGDKNAANVADGIKSYLQHIGLDEYATAFRMHGVTSLRLLKLLDSDAGKDVREKICDSIKNGWEADGKHAGSVLAASQVNTITADDVQAWIEKEQTSEAAEPEPDPKAIKEKQEQIRNAIEDVRKLREKWADVADKSAKAQSKEVAEKLDKIIAQFREEKSLTTFPSSEELAKDLDAYFKTAESALAHVSALTTAAVERKALTAVDLIFGHQLLRGHCVDANGMTEAPGGAVLAMPRRNADADLFGPGLQNMDFSRSYHSESAMMRAERLIETHAADFAVASEISGAAFLGSGIGAMSLAAKYAQSQEDQNKSAQAASSRSVTEIQTRYHWSPMRQIVFATNEFQLSSEALSWIRSVINKSSSDSEEHARRDRVREFMNSFGSHVFGRITFGGWYKYTARATSDEQDKKEDLMNAVSKGMDWAVSASATYVGLSGAGSIAASIVGKESNARVTGSEFRCTHRDCEVSIATTTLGGVDGLPREEWLGSLQYPAQWRVIQRDAPVPVWTLIRRIDPAILGADTSDKTRKSLQDLAEDFERVWVQDIFACSLDAALAEKVKKLACVEDLETLLKKEARQPESVSRMRWTSPDYQPADLFGKHQYANTHWTGPSVQVWQNQLYWYCAGWSEASKTLVGCYFDGALWRPFQTDSSKLTFKDQQWTKVEPAILGRPQNIFIFVALTGKTLAYAVASPLENLFHIPDDPLGGRAAAQVTPALVDFGDKTCLLYADPSGSIACSFLSIHGTDVKSSSNPVPLTGARTDKRIAATVFNNKLYCVYRGLGAEKLYCVSTTDGTQWTDPIPLQGVGASDGPALAVFAGPDGPRLYCAYPGSGGEGDSPLCIISTANGSAWSEPARIGDARSGHSPALVAFADQQGSKLYCFYTSPGSEDRLPLAYRLATWT